MREAALADVALQKLCAFALFGRRHQIAVIATVYPLHADDVGAKIGQQRGTVGARNIAPEIQDADALQKTCHDASPEKLFAYDLLRAIIEPGRR